MVKEDKVAVEVSGRVNWPMGNISDFNGPTLMTSLLVYSDDVKESEVMKAYDSVLDHLTKNEITLAELERIRTKFRSDWYSQLERPFSRASMLAIATLFDGEPSSVNRIATDISQITSHDIQAFIQKYLIKSNRTIINRVPDSSSKGE